MLQEFAFYKDTIVQSLDSGSLGTHDCIFKDDFGLLFGGWFASVEECPDATKIISVIEFLAIAEDDGTYLRAEIEI